MLTELLKKYKAPILYVFFGGVTTVINIVTYYICYELLEMGNDLSNVISWIITVTVAYVTNRIWVFESKGHGLKAILYEVSTFFACRIATGVLDFVIMHIGVDVMYGPAVVLKIISNILVIVLNYVASKLIIFKRGNENG